MSETNQKPLLPADYVPQASVGVLNDISSVELMDMRFKRSDFLVQSLLKPGLAVLAGSPKIGKSWLVLSLCLAVAQGKPFLGLDTQQGSVLYIALEDSPARLQSRLLCLTATASLYLRIATKCSPLGETLRAEITRFAVTSTKARLVVIDTFQKIREQGQEMSYSNDYSEVSYLKQIADENNICILLVHHTRKMADADCFNEISGTNGIAGSADTLMLLKKEKRTDAKAALTCTGRDIEDREMELKFDRERLFWRVVTDSGVGTAVSLPPEMEPVIDFVKSLGEGFVGTNTELCEQYNAFAGQQMSANAFKRRLNRWRFALEDRGVAFDSYRSNEGAREIAILYSAKMDKSIPITEPADKASPATQEAAKGAAP